MNHKKMGSACALGPWHKNVGGKRWGYRLPTQKAGTRIAGKQVVGQN